MSDRIFNFSAGPAVLPEEVLKKAQSELLNYQGTGMSIMEMSHRSKPFEAVLQRAKDAMKRLLSIPDTHEVLFLQGGASLQFSMVPLNLLLPGKPAQIFNTGAWSKKAIEETKRVAPNNYEVVATSQDKNFSYIPDFQNVKLNPDASYVYVTSNNTIFGTQWHDFPKTGNVPLISDMSSDILSRPINVSDFGLIFAGAQKNIGPSGVTVVIIRKDLAERCDASHPIMLQYRTHLENDSMYNTPPTFGIYMIMLVLEYLESLGGLSAVEAHNRKKAEILYSAIDNSDFYYCPTNKADRSLMNPVFRIKGDDEVLEAELIKQASARGISGIKGHRSVGGLRASIYNAQSIKAVETLVQVMKEFEQAH